MSDFGLFQPVVGRAMGTTSIGGGLFTAGQIRNTFDVTVDFHPNPMLIATKFYQLDGQIKSFREPLKRTIQEVIAPSFRINFMIGGRPAEWEPLQRETLIRKQHSQHQEVLMRTGLLEQVAQQFNIWKIDGQRGLAWIDSLPRAQYGSLHQSGYYARGNWTPARPWAVLQEEDIEAMRGVFAKWLEERIGATIGQP